MILSRMSGRGAEICETAGFTLSEPRQRLSGRVEGNSGPPAPKLSRSAGVSLPVADESDVRRRVEETLRRRE